MIYHRLIDVRRDRHADIRTDPNCIAINNLFCKYNILSSGIAKTLPVPPVLLVPCPCREAAVVGTLLPNPTFPLAAPTPPPITCSVLAAVAVTGFTAVTCGGMALGGGGLLQVVDRVMMLLSMEHAGLATVILSSKFI